MKNAVKKLDKLAVETLRMLSIDEVQAANSGHPGLPLGTAPLMYTIWERFLKYNPADPTWFNRDRFILSPGHGSALLYAMLHVAGFDLSLEELKAFRQWGSKTPGHPEYGVTPGVDASTGPLGHGISMAVGFALAEEMLASRYNKKGFKVVNHYTYGITSDGDLMEGVASEAASLAGTLGLGKLIFLYDNNHITIEGSTDIAFREDVARRFTAYGWQVLKVRNAENIEAIATAITEAQADKKHPSLIMVDTHIGYGSPKQDNPAAHGEPLGADGVTATKLAAGWDAEQSFVVPEAVAEHFAAKAAKGAEQEAKWHKLLAEYAKVYPELASELAERLTGKVEIDLAQLAAVFEGKEKSATREASGDVMQIIAGLVPAFAGGSADLGPSNKTVIKDASFVSAENKNGTNIHFGIREHGMGAVLNGMALHGGFVPYGATFLVFADFLRPAVRMAALMGIRSIFVFTHDSIAVGEDGPTHQPIEQTMSLRLIPQVTVLRPADALETAAAWKMAVENTSGPSCLILSRQKLPVLHTYADTVLTGALQGGYTLRKGEGETKAVIIATGSEVHVALSAQELLKAEGISVDVVSMPSWEVFRSQDSSYQAQVLPEAVPVFAVEAGVTTGWSSFTGSEKRTIGINHFGASAPGGKVYAEYGFTAENVASIVKENL